MTLAISAGILIGGSVYLMMRRDMLRIALGFTLLSHGVNLILIATGGTWGRNEPFGHHTASQMTEAADPCLLYTSPSPRDGLLSRMPSSA